MSGPCLCGAADCRCCHPELFRGAVYVGDCETEDDLDAVEDAAIEAALNRAENNRDDDHSKEQTP